MTVSKSRDHPVEVIDALVDPLDFDTVMRSLAKDLPARDRPRGEPDGGFGAELAARLPRMPSTCSTPQWCGSDAGHAHPGCAAPPGRRHPSSRTIARAIEQLSKH